MKVYLPKNHNELLLSDVKYGECFWFQKELYIKTNAIHYISLSKGNLDSLDGVKLSNGVLYHWLCDPVVSIELNVAVLELNENE